MAITLPESSVGLREAVEKFCDEHLEQDEKAGITYVFGKRTKADASHAHERIWLRILTTVTLLVSLSMLSGCISENRSGSHFYLHEDEQESQDPAYLTPDSGHTHT